MSSQIMKSSTSRKTITEEIKGTTSEIIRQVKKLIKEGNARRLIIKDKKGKILFQTQLTIGVAGTAVVTAMAPVISAISMFALFMNDIKIVVEKYPEEENAEDRDEYEVEAEYIEIRDEEDPEAEEEKKETAAEEKEENNEPEEKTDKTVGKKDDEA